MIIGYTERDGRFEDEFRYSKPIYSGEQISIGSDVAPCVMSGEEWNKICRLPSVEEARAYCEAEVPRMKKRLEELRALKIVTRETLDLMFHTLGTGTSPERVRRETRFAG